MRPTAPQRPRLLADGPRALSFEERVALFVRARHREEVDELLGGFSASAQARARAYAALVATWDSAQRQARLAHEFAGRPDAGPRLEALVAGAPPGLQAALIDKLPESLRVTQPLGGVPTSPATRCLAARLVREASR